MAKKKGAASQKQEEKPVMTVHLNDKKNRNPVDIKILKAKINSKHRTLEVMLKEIYEDGTSYEVTKMCTDIAHPDLEAAFLKLAPHLIIICDQRGAELCDDGFDESINALLEYAVTGFIIKDEEDASGIMLIGRKDIDGKVLNILSPFTKWTDSYRFHSELGEDVESCIHEVKEYLNGKFAEKQLEMAFDEEEPAEATEEVTD